MDEDSPMIRLTPVPDQPEPFMPAEEFPAFARERWTEAKDAYAEAFRATSSLHYLMHKPGQVKVAGTVTGALHEAKKLRDEADRMVVALDAIVRTGKAAR